MTQLSLFTVPKLLSPGSLCAYNRIPHNLCISTYYARNRSACKPLTSQLEILSRDCQKTCIRLLLDNRKLSSNSRLGAKYRTQELLGLWRKWNPAQVRQSDVSSTWYALRFDSLTIRPAESTGLKSQSELGYGNLKIHRSFVLSGCIMRPLGFIARQPSSSFMSVFFRFYIFFRASSYHLEAKFSETI